MGPVAVDLFVPLDEVEAPLERVAERALGWARGSAFKVRAVRRSLDARKGRPIGYRIRCLVAANAEQAELLDREASPPDRAALRWPSGRPAPRVVIVGSGPAGTWAALRLLEGGVAATIIERGQPVQPRRHDLAAITRGRLNADSNYCFGEGGAGTYSDGKLYTRSKDREGVGQVLRDLVHFGAPPEIAIESRPHVGSNRLPKVLLALRDHLQKNGVTYRFGAELVKIRTDRGRVRAVGLRDGDELPADILILAVGHSARSVYELAHHAGIAMIRKPIAVGVRIEHPQRIINELQYGDAANDVRLPPAFYELSAKVGNRGVYSFCMCPGGWIVPAATEPDGVVVNGMSLSRRDSPYANAGLVVTVEAEDFGPDGDGPLAGVGFQRRIERAAFDVGGGLFRAPAQRLPDLLANRPSTTVGSASYRPGLLPADLRSVFPAWLVDSLRDGLKTIGSRLPGFLHPDALLIGCETRTSAPVRFLRDAVSLQSPSCEGLYPVGEGAGYAGGIVSAALDGARAARRILVG